MDASKASTPFGKAELEDLAFLTAVLDFHAVTHALIGDWASAAWGLDRGPYRLEVLVQLQGRKRERVAQALAARWRIWSEKWQYGPRVNVIFADGIRARLPLHLVKPASGMEAWAAREAATRTIRGVSFSVVRVEDLIAMKLAPDDPKEHADARALLKLWNGRLDGDRLHEAAEGWGVQRRLWDNRPLEER